MNVVPAITAPHLTGAIAAAIWFAIAVVRYRRGELKGERLVISVVGILGLTLFAAGVFAQLPQPEQVLEDISGALGKWTYLLVTVLAFLETGAFVGLVAPGEAAVIVGGVVAGQGEIDIRLLIGLVWAAAFLGDSVSYYFGKRLGREFLVKHGARVKITEQRLEQVERYMRDHGGKTILIGRFIGLVRALAPFIAGSSHMPYRRFVPYDIIGSGLWAAFFCMLGYIFSNNLESVISYAERGVLIFGWTIGTIVAIVYLVRRFRKPEERAKFAAWLDEQERQHPRRGKLIRPLRRAWQRFGVPVARFFGPQLKFAWRRLTPGRLGLEFTTTMAVLLVAGWTFYFFLVAALDWPDNTFTTRMNDWAFRVADSIRTEWLNTAAEWVTTLGAFPVAGVFALAGVVYCLVRRKPAEATVLFFGMLICLVVTTTVKNWTDVPRPSGSLVKTEGASFPSGHSAYAVAYVAIAIAFERVRDLLTRAALVIAAIGLTAVIALTRVYLRAHYLSDAIGGVALGFLAYASLAAIALIVLHLRLIRRERAAGQAAPAAAADIVD